MNIEMILESPAVSEADIVRLERTLDVELPRSYRLLLVRTNGGRPKSPYFPISGLAGNPGGCLNFVFDVTSEFEVNRIEWQYAFHHNRIPSQVLLVASNPGSDFICLDLRNGQQRVGFWDYAHFWSTGEWRESDAGLLVLELTKRILLSRGFGG